MIGGSTYERSAKLARFVKTAIGGRVWLALVAAAAALPVPALGAGAYYSKSESLPPLQLRYSEIEAVLAKASRIATDANLQMMGSSNTLAQIAEEYGGEREEGEALRSAERRRTSILSQFPSEETVISIPGEDLWLDDHLVSKASSAPERAYSLRYSYEFRATRIPVGRINVDLTDGARTIEVRGNSAEHVDAVMNTLRSDLLRFSARFGGSQFRLWSGMAALECFCVLFFGSFYLLPKRRGLGIASMLVASVGIIGLILLPFDRLIPGFAVYRGDPSFLVRYGPELGFAGLLLSVLSLLVTFYQIWFQKGKDSSPKKRTPKKRPATGAS